MSEQIEARILVGKYVENYPGQNAPSFFEIVDEYTDEETSGKCFDRIIEEKQADFAGDVQSWAVIKIALDRDQIEKALNGDTAINAHIISE